MVSIRGDETWVKRSAAPCKAFQDRPSTDVTKVGDSSRICLEIVMSADIISPFLVPLGLEEQGLAAHFSLLGDVPWSKNV